MALDTPTPIVQFGTSRFLQAHVDLFVDEARRAGEPAGPVTVVAASGSAQGRARLKALCADGGYPVHIRGQQDGKPVERQIQVTSITRALEATSDWGQLARIFVEQAVFVVSNTTESGLFVPDDLVLDLSAPVLAAPPTYPAKLLALLRAREAAGADGLTILPTELVGRNGDLLKRKTLDLAKRSRATDALLSFIADRCMFANSLVDRIVSSPIEPAGAVAEPYALWALEKQEGLRLPCRHPAISLVEDLEPVERLKLHILNLGHTVLADLWLRRGLAPELTVRQMLATPDTGGALLEIYRDEVLPGFASRGMGAEAEAYLATTLERFANPFLDHRISDIAVNQKQKTLNRIRAFLEWTQASENGMPRLWSIAART